MSRLNGARVIEMPPFRAVSSGYDTFDRIFAPDGFNKWIGDHGSMIKQSIYGHAYDFMWHEDDKTVWIWAVEDGVNAADTAPYELLDFEGGMYVVATANEDDSDDLWEVTSTMAKWIADSGVFEDDSRPGHRGMGHMVGCGAIQKALGFGQQEIFFPVKFRAK